MPIRRPRKSSQKVCAALIFTHRVEPWAVTVSVHDGDQLVGELSATSSPKAGRDPARLEVRTVFVEEAYQRCGIATRMYELAARQACDTDAVLASDNIRSDAAHNFWLKQVKNKRAWCVSKGKPYYDLNKGGCEYYALKSCPVESLRGSRRRFR